jgi:flavin-dependent dehydrogenase
MLGVPPLSEFDVIIVGAGPAGCATAIRCAGAGLRVALLERANFPRHAPGESLHPGVQPLLRHLGVEDRFLEAGFLRYPGIVVEWGASEFVREFGADENGPWLGFQAWRADLDAILLERARDLGVTVLQPASATGAHRGPDGAVRGVETSDGPITAEFTVDATGRWRALSRWLAIDWDQHGHDRRVWFGYVAGDCPSRRDRPAIRADKGGWTWVARVRESTYQWTRMNFDGSRPPDGWLPPELLGLNPIGVQGGQDVTWRIATRPSGPGYFLAGDAAATLDPASSHGVLKALMSGIMIGDLLEHMFAGRIDDLAAMAHYQRFVTDWFRSDLDELTALYDRLGSCPR